VGPSGKVYYTDGDERNAKLAEDFLTRAHLRDRVEIMVGDALTSFNSVPGEFDVIFNDVDKEGYPDVYRKAAGRVRVGGLLIRDNVLCSARVVDRSETQEAREGIRQFNRMLSQDQRFRTVILPLRDGVTIAQRLQ